jgi:hypothetical protein
MSEEIERQNTLLDDLSKMSEETGNSSLSHRITFVFCLFFESYSSLGPVSPSLFLLFVLLLSQVLAFAGR